MDAGDLGLLLCLSAGGLFGGLWFGVRRLSRARLIENTPTARIRSAAQGYVELEGRARLMDGEKIVAPLTRSPCAWWEYTVERKEKRGKHTAWAIVRRGRSDDLFLLDDTTGACIVDADGATVTPSVKHVWYGRGPQPDLGPKAGGGWLRALFSPYRYTEMTLAIGGPLYALGWFRTEGHRNDPQDENTTVRELLAEWKRDAVKMKLFDANKDGQVDMKEWEAVRRMALQKVRQQTLEHATDPDYHLLRKPPDGRDYLLSGVSQQQMVQGARWQALLAFSIAIAGAAGLAKLLA